MATGDWKTFYSYYGTDKYKLHRRRRAELLAASLRPRRELGKAVRLSLALHVRPSRNLLALAHVSPRARRLGGAGNRAAVSALRDWLWLSAGLTVIVLGFYLTRTQNYNYGGNTAGLRWIFWLIPLWLVSCIPALDACAGRRSTRNPVPWLLLAVTTFSSWYPIDNPWQHPWLFRVMERWAGSITATAPRIHPTGDDVLSPVAPPDASAHEWIEFESAGRPAKRPVCDSPTRERSRRKERIAPGRRHLEPRDKCRADRSFHNRSGKVSRRRSPPEFPRAAQTGGDSEGIKQAESFLQGLPTRPAYRRGTVRYVKTPLRHDAFECRLAAAQISQDESPTSDRELVYRIDVWLTAAVPFGTLQFEQTVRDGDTSEVLLIRRFTAVASSRSFRDSEIPAKSNSGLNLPD